MHFLKQNKMNTGREANNSCTAVIAKNESDGLCGNRSDYSAVLLCYQMD